ncbi:MAG: zinc-binding dehydrogenase [Clostridia bacterium]|nr:zinc-binding dehydrogenase [Clostridia bacterium]
MKDVETMKALTVFGPGDARITEVPAPHPHGDMVKIKVVRTGVCATDQAIFTGNCSFVRSGEIVYPVRMGHEYSGVVSEVGEDVKSFFPGDRVFTDNGVSCGKCQACLEGRYGDCLAPRSVGTVNCWDGCYAEYMYMPERHVYRIPDSLGFEEAALIEPASISLDAFHGITDGNGETAVVIGTGAIGMACAWIARYLGYGRVAVVGRSPKKLEVALKIGADTVINSRESDVVDCIKGMTDGRGAAHIIETSGDGTALVSAIRSAAKDGRVSMLGFYEKDLDGIPVDQIVLNRITLRGGAGRFGNPSKVAEIMAKNPVPLTPVITHRIRFEDCLDIFKNEKAYHDSKIKAMVCFD